MTEKMSIMLDRFLDCLIYSAGEWKIPTIHTVFHKLITQKSYNCSNYN